MEAAKFRELKEWVETRLNEKRAEGAPNDILRCWLIGVVESTFSDMEEEIFTAGQLKELFDLTFI